MLRAESIYDRPADARNVAAGQIRRAGPLLLADPDQQI
jgi:hypothetical protein